MKGRAAWLLIVLVLSAGLAGCTDDAPRSSQPPADDGGESDEPAAWPLIGHPPQVLAVPLTNEGGGPTLTGFVYDFDTGAPMATAEVFATCIRAGLGPVSTQAASTNEDGAFAFPEVASWTGCTEITYQVAAPGFTLSIPLSGPGLGDNTATIVYAGVVALVPG